MEERLNSYYLTMIARQIEGGKNFGCDFETEMDALPFVKIMLSEPALRVFLSDNDPVQPAVRGFLSDNYPVCLNSAREIHDEIRKMRNLRVHTKDDKRALIECLRLHARHVGIIVRNTKMRSYLGSMLNGWYYTVHCCINYLKQTEAEGELDHNIDIDAVINSINDIKQIDDLLPDEADSSICLTTKEKSRALLLMTAFPGLHDPKEPYKVLEFLLELSKELDNLPELICEACEGQPLSLLLIGSLLSLKPRAYDKWNGVKVDLVKIKEPDHGATNNHTWHILKKIWLFVRIKVINNIGSQTYTFVDKKPCYPIDYEIHARSLIEIRIAEKFVTLEEGVTREETAYKYLEQLVQRSLVCVSKRSFLGTIKCCRVRPSIHEFASEESCKDGFLVANPDEEKIKSVHRLAIHLDNKKHYKLGVNINHIRSFLAFDFHRNVFGIAKNLKVLELRRSTISEITLPVMKCLRYLGLRGSNISKLPEKIGDMKELQTLDVRDTSIETLPESLWNISVLRHVYVKSSPQIKGPPSAANISDLHILKTVVVPESWLENIPNFLINLRKLALSNSDNLNWKSVLNLLSHMNNLLSMEIIGKNLPSQFVDIRAFDNLKTVKSIKLEGEWYSRKLPIDNITFPPYLTKLTLTNSGLKEDPMPRLEKLQALKYLSLQDGAYTGNKMVCSSNGFPQLQILELKKMENLEIWEVKLTALSQLTTLRVVQCQKLKNLPDLEHVTEKVIDN